MKRLIQLVLALGLAFFLVACGSQNDESNAADGNENADTEGQTEEQADDNTDDNDNSTTDEMDDTSADNQDDSDQDMTDKMDELDYAEFELEADYGKNNEYEAEIEQDKGEIEADLEDEVKDNIDTNGKEAFDKIYPNVEKLTIDGNTSKEDAIDQVLEAFGLDSDYEEIEIEITLQDGTKIEFEDQK